METGLVDGVLSWQSWRGRRLRATTVAGQSGAPRHGRTNCLRMRSSPRLLACRAA